MNFTPPKQFITKVESLNYLNQKVLEAAFSFLPTDTFSYRPGQFINIKVDQSKFRSYSICGSVKSPDGTTTAVKIVAAVGHDGLGSNFLKGLKVGDEVELMGPSGRFVLPEAEKLAPTLVFVATGTGLAPIADMLDALCDSKPPQVGRIDLFFGVRDDSELFYADKILNWSGALHNFKAKVCFSQACQTSMPNLGPKIEANCQSRVTTAFKLADYDLPTTQFYLCGNPFMVSEMAKLLADGGVGESAVFHERFTVATPKK